MALVWARIACASVLGVGATLIIALVFLVRADRLGSVLPVDPSARYSHHGQKRSANFSQGKEGIMRVRFLGKDPDSQVDNSPTLFATDRSDRTTYIVQGWRVTDPQALAEIGDVPDHETLVEVPEEILRFYARRYQEQEGEH